MSDSDLANDRTFLAWFRTAIALFGLGFVISKVALIVDEGSGGVSDEALYTGIGWPRSPAVPQSCSSEALYTGIGVATVLCGAAVVLVGLVQHTRVWQYLHADAQVPPPRWARSMTIAAVVGSLVLSTLLIVTT